MPPDQVIAAALPLMIAAGLLVFILVIMYGLTVWKTWKSKDDEDQPLAIPSGSVRSLLALLIVGGFIIFLFFGSNAVGDNFDKILAAFAALAGSATGFYFGSRPNTAIGTAGSPQPVRGASPGDIEGGDEENN